MFGQPNSSCTEILAAWHHGFGLEEGPVTQHVVARRDEGRRRPWRSSIDSQSDALQKCLLDNCTIVNVHCVMSVLFGVSIMMLARK